MNGALHSSVESIETWDVLIVGGGPAGLSAALLLGRCRRKVLVLDDGQPRNRHSRAAHAVFTRDGEAPLDLLRVAREQLARYDVQVRHARVERAVRRRDGCFELETSDRTKYISRKLLLATGIVDELPQIPEFDAIYGVTGFHCPYCDGWEFRDRRLAVLAHGSAGVEYALGVTTWSRDVVLCTNGRRRLTEADRASLQAHGIDVYHGRISKLEHVAGNLTGIAFADGKRLERDAVFFHGRARQHSDLARQLECSFTREDKIESDDLAGTGEGLYVAGDAAREVHFVSIAAAEGLKAAFAINRELRAERSRRTLDAYLAARRLPRAEGEKTQQRPLPQ